MDVYRARYRGRHRRRIGIRTRTALLLLLPALATTAGGLLTNMAGAAPTAAGGVLTFASAAIIAWAYLLSVTPAAESRMPAAARRVAIPLLVCAAVLIAGFAYWPTLGETMSRVRDPDLLFVDDFRSGSGWPTGDSGHGRAQYTGQRLQILTVKGDDDWRQAPFLPAAGSIQVTTTASLASGQGGWGSWCRGTDDGTARYWAAITHGHAIAFGTPSRPYVVIAKPPVELDAYATNSVTIDCRDADGTVRISIKLNGRWICTLLDHGRLLGPGRVGVMAFSFVDAGGPTADARIARFEVRRASSPVPAGTRDCMTMA